MVKMQLDIKQHRESRDLDGFYAKYKTFLNGLSAVSE